jgi:hypothetical protein
MQPNYSVDIVIYLLTVTPCGALQQKSSYNPTKLPKNLQRIPKSWQICKIEKFAGLIKSQDK